MFGVLKSVLLDALPYAETGRLVRVYGTGWQEREPISAAAAGDLGARQRSFASMAAFSSLVSDVALAAGAGAALLVPVRRATRVDPAAALRAQ